MKKILCILLVCLMFPFASYIISGCSTNNYDLHTFSSTYQSFVDNYNNLALDDAEKLNQSDPSSKRININYVLAPELSRLVEQNSTPYYYLKYFYQQLLDDSLAPLYFYGDTISQSGKVSKKQTEKLFNSLNALQEDYNNIDYYLGILNNALKANSNSSISHLRKLFEKYEQAILSANKLSAVVCDVYFNTVVSSSNIDYSQKDYAELTDADITSITLNIRSRIYYYKSIYAHTYNQVYVVGQNMADKLAGKLSTPPTYAPYEYIKNIKSLESKNPANLTNSKQAIYNYSVAQYNIQSNFNTAYNEFNTACSKLESVEANKNNQLHIDNYNAIVLRFANGIAYDSYEIIENLIDLLYD